MARGTDGDAAESTADAAISAETATAFSVVGDETRIAILNALWEHIDPLGDEAALSFSQLRERVGMRDSGQFNYHLNQLRGRFVEQVEAGYRLTHTGEGLVQTVIAGVAIDEPSVEPVELDRPCPFCGGVVEFEYANERVSLRCTDCPGGGPALYDHIAILRFPPAGIEGRDPTAIADAAITAAMQYTMSMMADVCYRCGGRTDRWLDVCPDHDPDPAVCPHCDRRFLATANLVCGTCKASMWLPSWMAIFTHPHVLATFVDRPGPHPLHSWERLFEAGLACEEEVRSLDPPRLAIHLPEDRGAVSLTFDEHLRIDRTA